MWSRCKRLGTGAFHALTLPVLLAGLLIRLIRADVLDDVGGFFGGIFGGIGSGVRDFVTAMSRWVYHTLLHLIRDIESAVWDGIRGIWGWLSEAFQNVWGYFAYVVNLIVDYTQSAIQYAYDAVSGVYGWVSGAIGQIWQWLSGLPGWVIDQITAVYNWVIDNIWTPFVHSLEALWHFVSVDIPNYVAGSINNVWCWVKDFADAVPHIAAGVTGAIIGPFMDVLRIALKAIDWLTFFALHPFDWFTKLLTDVIDKGGAWFVHTIMASIEKHERVVDDWLSRWIKNL